MRTNKRFQTILAMLAAVILLTASLSCASSLKERMKQRIPAIKELKTNGAVGESNQGLLIFKKDSPAQLTLINDENSDRLKVYTAIAKKQGTTVNFVGSRRAAQIAAKAKNGAWLQNENGTWYQK